MGYEFKLDKILLPVPPSSFQYSIKGNNKKINSINEGELLILKKAKLSELSFEFMLPNVRYPFAVYENNSFRNAKYFLDEIEKLKVAKKPFNFIIDRSRPDGSNLYDYKEKVVIDDYTLKEGANQGLDVMVSIKLTQYRAGAFNTIKLKVDKKGKKKIKTKKKRQTHNAPMSDNKTKSYKVSKGDSLWLIAKKFYGDGSKYKKIKEANKSKLKRGNMIFSGQILTIPK
nr:MAG TPA: tail assembly protein [Caudoviricetes sp.]